MRQHLVLIALITLLATPALGQEEQEYGRVLTVSGKSLTVQFGQRDIKVGDEIDFWRFTSIIDPVTGIERGRPKTLIGKGIVDEIGLGKASVSITEQSPSNRITISDLALPTGSKKMITRKTANIQEISADKKNMVIDLGTKDEVSEGDEFLIQRSENIYDKKTKQITGTSQVDVGRGRVSAVKDRSSTAAITILQPGMEILKTDQVVFTPEQKKATAEPGEFEQLKKEVAALKVTVDSLGAAQLLYREDFITLKKEIESVVPSLTSLDRDADRIVMKNVETILAKRSGAAGTVMTRYRRALDDCLKRRIPRAQKEFQEIMDANPDIPLVENCRYWISQCRYASKDYPAAAAGFQSVLDDTRFTHKDDDASIMLGISFFQMSRLPEALDQLHRFVESFPKSEYRGKVEQWIERISLIKSRG